MMNPGFQSVATTHASFGFQIRRRLLFVISMVASVVVAMASVSAQGPKIREQTALADRIEFESSQVWVTDYFAKRNSVADEVANLFRDLGNTDYRKRKAAQRQLQTLPYVPRALIEEYSNVENPEIRFFVKSLTSKRAELERLYFHLVLDAIAHKRFNGFAKDLIGLIDDEENESYVQWIFPIAIWGTVEPKDREMLVKLMDSDRDILRRASVWGLTALEKESGVALDPKFYKGDSKLKLARALALLANQNADCIPMLVRLLEDEDRALRIQSETTLRRLSGTWQGYVGGAESADRRKAVEGWLKWSEEFKPEELNFFHPGYLLPEYRLLGNQLIGFKVKDGECGLMELSPAGSLVRRIGNSPCYWAEFLDNGNLLCTLRVGDQPAVVEMTREGKIVWQYDGHFLLKAHALENGNVLICFQDDKRVIEVNRQKEIVWGMVTNGKCNDARVLPDGRKLIGTDEGLFLVGLDGNEEQIYADKDISGIEIQANGELLVTTWKGSRAMQLSLKGEKRWEYGVTRAISAHRSIDGSYAFSSDGQGYVFLDRKRKLSKTLKGFAGRVILK